MGQKAKERCKTESFYVKSQNCWTVLFAVNNFIHEESKENINKVDQQDTDVQRNSHEGQVVSDALSYFL